ncbi:MAG: M48 family metallopeptidase [Clostridia bacterium]|nr:M48 family metallopeptidase [Clostridia bacterium]
MTLKITVILLALLGSLYSLVLSIVKYRSANNPTPKNLSDVYDAETYEKWKKYSAEHSRLSIVSAIVSCVVTLILLATDVYAAFASVFPNRLFMQTFAVVLLETAVGTVVGVIESYVSNMIIEQKYGFNRTSIKTFIFDRIRSLALGLLLSIGIAMLIAVLYENLGVWMIVLFAAIAFGWAMIFTFLYPVFSRIGNKFTPLEDGELKEKLMALLNKYGYKVKAIEVMDASRRTTKLNAYFTGFGKMKTIVLYDNLLSAMSEDEICAIFAHEMGHGLHKDVLKTQILNVFYMLLIGAMAWGALSLPELYTAFGFDGINYGFTYILLGIGLGVLQPLISLILNAMSRAHEYRADRQAVIEGYGTAMISAFKKLAKDNFSHLAPSKLNVVLEYSHPPLDRRVEEVEKAMKNI